jgi:hypothetical protein
LLKNENATYVAESFLAFFLLKILTDYAKNNPKIGFPEKKHFSGRKMEKIAKMAKIGKMAKIAKMAKIGKMAIITLTPGVPKRFFFKNIGGFR